MRNDFRPGRIDLHMHMAWMWAKRSNCKRVGNAAIITTDDLTQVLSIGYNGPAKDLPNDRCRGKQAEGACGCLHAEDNAIARVDSTILNKAIICTTSPCEMCAQRILQANIATIYFEVPYRDDTGVRLLLEAKRKVLKVVPDARWTIKDEMGRNGFDLFEYRTFQQDMSDLK